LGLRPAPMVVVLLLSPVLRSIFLTRTSSLGVVVVPRFLKGNW
jgi:hypothetical protein